MTRYVSVLLVALWGVGVACTPGTPPPSKPIDEPSKPIEEPGPPVTPPPARPVVPSAPGAVRAEAEVGGATLTWSAPAQDGGSALTGYQVEGEPREAAMSVRVQGTTALVSGLRAGTTYRFSVGARNEVGVGPVSTSAPVTLPDVPTAPREVSATRGNRQAEVVWSPPVLDGGRPVLGYLVTAHPQGLQVPAGATARSVVVGGLTNGAASTFTVRARNAVGEGPDSLASTSVVPAAVPSAPEGVTARAGVRELTVTWSAPADLGGSPVVEYVVRAEPGGQVVRVDASARGATVTGLRDSTEYTLGVTARNDVGEGLPASVPPLRTLQGAPSAPRAVKATREVRAVKVAWEAPAEEGGTPVTGYTVEVQPTGARMNAGAGVREVTVTSLPSTRAYTFTVSALNAVGTGPAARSSPVRPLPTPARVSALAVPTSPNGCVSITYTLGQDDGERADVLVEVEAQGSGTFRPATQAGSTDQEGTLARPTSSTGVEHRVLWNRALDVRGAASVQVRVSARVAGAVAGSRTVAVSLPAASQGCEPALEGAFASPFRLMSDPLAGSTLTVGDFDQDGKQDVIALTYYPTGFLLMKGLGNGRFLPGQKLELGVLRSVHFPSAAADLDGDGALDFLWVDDSRLNVARGLGNGSFMPTEVHETATGVWLTADKPGLVVADFNGDGRLDVAMGSGRGPGLFLTQADGTFGAFQPLNVSAADLLSADFDADGRRDLVLLRWNTPGAVLLSNGDGTFRSRPTDLPPSLVLGDVDGDGRVDALSVSYIGDASEVLLRRGDGLGGFGAATRVATVGKDLAAPSLGGNLVVDDLDGDGRLDFAVATFQNLESHLLALVKGRGDGTFAPAVTLPMPRYAAFLTSGDFNGDAVADLVAIEDRSQFAGYQFGDVRVWPGGPERLARSTPMGPLGAVATGDLNGDGWTDVLSATRESSSSYPLKLFLGGPAGLSAPRTLLELSNQTGNFILAIDILRVDADAALDVVLHDDSRTLLLLGNGDGSLRLVDGLQLEFSDHLQSGDVNQDGKPDLVFTTRNSSRSVDEVRLRLGVGNGTFAPPVVLGDVDNLTPAALADLNRDGSLDVMLMPRGSTGIAAQVLLGRGDGSFSSGPALALGGPGQQQVLRVADMDRDGLPDVVSCGSMSQDINALHVLKGAGDGSFTLASSTPATASCPGLLVVDLDGDGWRDVLGGRWSGDAVSLWSGGPQGQLGPERGFGTFLYDPSAVRSLAVLDANGDGRLDVLAGNGFRASTLLLQR